MPVGVFLLALRLSAPLSQQTVVGPLNAPPFRSPGGAGALQGAAPAPRINAQLFP